MPDHDTVLELYEHGISAHDLRRSYVGDKLDDVPYASHSRRELSEYAKEDEVFRIYWLPRTLNLLDRVESQVVNGLLSGDIVALGYADPRDLTLESVPSQQWHFLNLDFEKGAATGTDLHYAGLSFLPKDDLTDDQIQAMQASPDQPQAQRSPVNEIGALLNLFATDWNQVTIRLLKDFFVAVRIQDEEQRLSLGTLGLFNRTTGQPNARCVVLLKMANNQWVSTEQKHTVSDLRQLLQGLVSTTPASVSCVKAISLPTKSKRCRRHRINRKSSNPK